MENEKEGDNQLITQFYVENSCQNIVYVCYICTVLNSIPANTGFFQDSRMSFFMTFLDKHLTIHVGNL